MQLELLPAIGKGSSDLVALTALAEGYHECTVPNLPAGTRYHFVLPDGRRVPDPASRFQPQDVHGPSELIDPLSYRWNDSTWQGRPWYEAVLYELHLGAFTPEGTFRAAIERLDHLQQLGITAIEIMPVADFPGRYNWGYDGALIYAPDSVYGRPEDFKAFVDAAHARKLMVLLDVVYNHFGPDGNFLPSYAPAYFTDRHKTPWGSAVNYDGPHSRPVREFVIQNALYWINEFHLDGLRLDAVHAIIDNSDTHLLDELAQRVRASTSRSVHLILENEENEVSLLGRNVEGVPERYSAQWNDDVHHALHVAATGEDQGYYQDYANDLPMLACALSEGFGFQGQLMPYSGRHRGEPSACLPPTAFIAFLQNHDQIGNRAFGDRLTSGISERTSRALVATVLLLPQIPMLFMGEEFGATQPFPFFCDFSGDLGESIRSGRRLEFAKFAEFRDETLRDRIPDPLSLATYQSAKLNWPDAKEPRGMRLLTLYRSLLEVRRRRLFPLLSGIKQGGKADLLGSDAIQIRWRVASAELILTANLSHNSQVEIARPPGETLWQEGTISPQGDMSPWFVHWAIDANS